MNSGIYMLLNLVTDMYYVGQACNFNKRWANHLSMLSNNKHFNILLQRAYNKYGEESFKFYVLELVADKTKLEEREQFWMDHSKCYERGIGYNIRKIADSNLGLKASEETRIKISLAGKGRKFSEEAKRKLSVKLKGNKSKTGKKISEETRIKMSVAATGRICSNETKIKISLAAKNRFSKNDLAATIR